MINYKKVLGKKVKNKFFVNNIFIQNKNITIKIITMKNIYITIIIIIAYTILIVGLTQMYYQCPPSKIIYKYVPRTFREEQESPVPVSEIFASMFNNQTPWIADTTSIHDRLGNLNKYYISDEVVSGGARLLK
jgi:hypothetical protein